MSQPYYCLNGQFIEKENLSLGINRAFKFGDGLFETVRLVNGQAQNFSDHIERLTEGMKFLKLQFDENFDKLILLESEQLIRKNKQFKGGVLRIYVFRAGMGKYTPQSNQLEYLIETEELSENNYSLNDLGLRIELAESTLITPSKFTKLKSLNALPYVMASIEKEERLFDDLLLLNNDHQIVEATSSNVFLVKKNELLTPPISSGCLSGVMRKRILKIASTVNLIPKESAISVNDLLEADEVFLTNTISGIRWVGAFRKKRYFHNWAKKLMEKI